MTKYMEKTKEHSRTHMHNALIPCCPFDPYKQIKRTLQNSLSVTTHTPHFQAPSSEGKNLLSFLPQHRLYIIAFFQAHVQEMVCVCNTFQEFCPHSYFLCLTIKLMLYGFNVSELLYVLVYTVYAKYSK